MGIGGAPPAVPDCHTTVLALLYNTKFPSVCTTNRHGTPLFTVLKFLIGVIDDESRVIWRVLHQTRERKEKKNLQTTKPQSFPSKIRAPAPVVPVDHNDIAGNCTKFALPSDCIRNSNKSLLLNSKFNLQYV